MLITLRVPLDSQLGGLLCGAAVELFYGPDGKQHVASSTTNLTASERRRARRGKTRPNLTAQNASFFSAYKLA